MLTRSGWATLVAAVSLGAASVALHLPSLVVLAAGGTLALGASMASVALRPRLGLERRLDRSRVSAGEPVPVELTVTNTRGRPTLASRAVDRLAGGDVVVSLPAQRGHASRVVSYLLPAAPRGVYLLDPLVAQRPDPLGLTRLAPMSTDDRSTVWVHPRTYVVAPLPTGRRLAEDGPTGRTARQGAQVFHSLREYVIGDDVRHIHWRATAHAGELMVRENLETTDPRGVVVLDTRSAAHTPASFEVAVEVAASLLVASLSLEVPLSLVTTAGRSISVTHAGDLLDDLAALEPDEDASLGGLRPGPSGSMIDAGSSVVMVTGELSPADADALSVIGRRAADAILVLVRPGASVARSAVSSVVEVTSGPDFAALWNQLNR